jgi:hypothetical protein
MNLKNEKIKWENIDLINISYFIINEGILKNKN